MNRYGRPKRTPDSNGARLRQSIVYVVSYRGAESSAHWERRYFIGSGRTSLSPRHGMKRGKLETRISGGHTPEPVKNRRSQYRASFMSLATVVQREAHWERRYFIGSGRTHLSPRHGMKRGKLETRISGGARQSRLKTGAPSTEHRLCRGLPWCREPRPMGAPIFYRLWADVPIASTRNEARQVGDSHLRGHTPEPVKNRRSQYRASFMSWATVVQRAAPTGSADILSALGGRPYRLGTE